MAWVILGNGNGMGWERRLETLLLTPTYPPFSQTLLASSLGFVRISPGSLLFVDFVLLF